MICFILIRILSFFIIEKLIYNINYQTKVYLMIESLSPILKPLKWYLHKTLFCIKCFFTQFNLLLFIPFNDYWNIIIVIFFIFFAIYKEKQI